MVDAQATLEGPQREDDTTDRDGLKRAPNLFRLLDLVDEHGLSGIVEKIVIDQTSLHRLLNTVQPGSYDSVSKINFKSLDKLCIKATGLYGTRAEIVKFLKQSQCLSDDAAAFLSGGVTSTVEAPSVLRSGLYLILRSEDESPENRIKQAYIVYWPEESTWDDQAASSSVRRNRVTFMRQIIALVSPTQASAFIWDMGARNKDLPADQMDNDDESRLFSFEVSKSLEQEEDAIASPGFTVRADSKHIPENPNELEMRLVPGEHKAALLVSVLEPPFTHHKSFSNESITRMRLQDMIKGSATLPQVQLGDLSSDGLMHLAENGLREKYRGPFQKHEQRIRDLKIARFDMETQDRKKIDESIERDTPMIRDEVRNAIRTLYCRVYPSFKVTMDMSHDAEASVALHSRYPRLSKIEDEVKKKNKLSCVSDECFQTVKSKWFLVRDYLTTDPTPSERDQARFLNDILNAPHEGSSSKPLAKNAGDGLVKAVVSGFKAAATVIIGSSNSPDAKQKSNQEHLPLSDPEFVSQLQLLQESFPALGELTKRVHQCLEIKLSSLEDNTLTTQAQKVIDPERKHQTEVASRARGENFRHAEAQAFEILVSELRGAMFTTAPHVIFVESLDKSDSRPIYGWGNDISYRWSGRHVIRQDAQTRCRIYPLELTEQDSQLCQSDEAYVPSPKLESRHKFEFALELGRKIEFLQLVRDKCLVVISESGKSHIYIEDKVNLNQSINTKYGKITLHHDSLGGPRCLFTLDQTTRLLAIVHGEKELKLSVYIFDELFGGLRSRGSPISLKGWYDANVRIDKVCFVSGAEEVCFIEDSGRARIFSLITQQFRTATLQIGSHVIDGFSAPDGSCLFVTVADQEAQPPREKLLAFHWASFGSNQSGIHVTDLQPSDAPRVVTRLEGRGRNHVLTFSAAPRSVGSMIIQVKQKATEFSFRSNRETTRATAVETLNNSLLDCHLEVWTRFPVVPAVSRCTLSPVNRQPRKLVFQSPVPLAELGDYFARMISSFERTTRKPMEGSLALISVFSTAGGDASLADSISEFLLGSFIVELLCLIPLHLAITRENRFIPLKDGVWDPAYERSLLGADVPAIIDALSLGWYESLFQSYMATKASYIILLVRVVSSMGEQSVGKSYCLNHFADTSFAGSAMRTTEGVWLSCTPTESYLLVSLDFEGVHSIERSAQEDALLVLFNTAVSNLVLFRNNFALSRDIAGLFTVGSEVRFSPMLIRPCIVSQSFQSSAMVLDPNANKSLFNSTLAIIIKDVTNSDANDIVKEYVTSSNNVLPQVSADCRKGARSELYFALASGHIQIIPWPVINSPNFYTLFRHLRQNLDRQAFTHGTGGAFLHNLKTLMAKIKAQDWGALDRELQESLQNRLAYSHTPVENLAAHRAKQLLERLPHTLSYGRTEEGPLKANQNVDTDEELASNDESVEFFVPEFAGGTGPENDASIEAALHALVRSCGSTVGPRQHVPDGTYVEATQDLLYKALDKRIDHVRNWAIINVARFPPGNQDIRNLFNKINGAALAMRAVMTGTAAEPTINALLIVQSPGSIQRGNLAVYRAARKLTRAERVVI
ncbi:hypothetical protein FRC10_006677 [Ceratobasidium sp. 414]|nr:hypothetical protein FRC10_006677 [Ceratobasidium sp. 414]